MKRNHIATTLLTASIPNIHCLKRFKEDASLHSAERPFQDLAPLYEEHQQLIIDIYFIDCNNADSIINENNCLF